MKREEESTNEQNERGGFLHTLIAIFSICWKIKGLLWDRYWDKNVIVCNYDKNASRATMDIYLPKHIDIKRKTTKKYHVACFAIGSGWCFGHKLWGIPLAQIFREMGFIAVVIDYPRYPSTHINEQTNYFTSAILWIINNISTYQGDINNISVGGYSSSSHILFQSILNETHNIKNKLSSSYNPTKLKSLYLMSAPFNLMKIYETHKDHLLDGWFLRHFFGLQIDKNNDKLSDENINKLNKFCTKSNFQLKLKNKEIESTDFPPIYMMHGDKDKTCHYQSAIQFYDILQNNGFQVAFHVLKGWDHVDYIFKDLNVLKKYFNGI